MMIFAPPAVVDKWLATAARAAQTARTPDDPDLAEAFAAAPEVLCARVDALTSALTSAAGVLLGSANSALPDATGPFNAGLAELHRDLAAARFTPAGDDGCEGGRA